MSRSFSELGLCESCANSSKAKGGIPASKCRVYGTHFGRVKNCVSYNGDQFPVDIAIVTAVGVESDAVKRYLLPAGKSAWSAIPQLTELEWERATYVSPTNPTNRLRLVLAQSRLKGLPAAAVQATRACHKFQPRYLVMLGITAGRQGKTSLGDIVVPDVVFDYGAGKWKGTSFTPEPHQLELESEIFRACLHIENYKSQLLAQIPELWNGELPGGAARPIVRTGHMVSGAAVVDSEEIWNRILAIDKAVLAIDMEAYSVLLAGRQVGLPSPRVLIAKSVCDYGVGKDDHAQKYAAFTSAHFLRIFMEEILLKDQDFAVS